MASFVSSKEFQKLKDQVAELQARVQALESHGSAVYEEAEEKPPETIQSIEEAVDGEENALYDLLDEAIAEKLIDSDYYTVEKVRAASDEQLQSVSGIGAATVRKIREALKGS